MTCRSVSLSVQKVCYGKTADMIRMPLWVLSDVGRGMGVVIVEGKGQFDDKMWGISHYNQRGFYCAVVRKCMRELIKLSFGVASVVGLGIRVYRVFQKTDPLDYFDDNFGKYGQILTTFSLLQQENYGTQY